MSARSEILALIGEIERAPASPVAHAYRQRGERDAAARTRLFAERVAQYGADVREISAATVADTIARSCREHGVVRLGVPPGLPHDWRPSTVETIEDHGLTPRELDALDGVATGCTIAVAESGTIVLAAGAAEGRRALTLVPDLHICVIGREQIVELLPEATGVLERLVRRERRPLTYISGPSATSDIELSRVEGVHGPRTLIALIVSEEEP